MVYPSGYGFSEAREGREKNRAAASVAQRRRASNAMRFKAALVAWSLTPVAANLSLIAAAVWIDRKPLLLRFGPTFAPVPFYVPLDFVLVGAIFALSYDILDRHGGRIEARGRTDDGTEFIVHLPIHSRAEEGVDAAQ